MFTTPSASALPMHTGIGTLIEFWKVTKAMDVSVSDKFPFLSIKDRVSYSNNPTKEYDRTAMRYLSYALYPLIIGYSIYALMYETHKSWYSWFLGSLVGAVYAFGFILMCPQVCLCGGRGGVLVVVVCGGRGGVLVVVVCGERGGGGMWRGGLVVVHLLYLGGGTLCCGGH